MELVEPMRENRPNSYQMKAVPADPDAVSETEVPVSFVGFEIAFGWQGRTSTISARPTIGCGSRNGGADGNEEGVLGLQIAAA